MGIFHRQRIYCFFFAFIFTSCIQQKSPDIGHINIEIKINRFDQKLGQLTPKNSAEKNKTWQKTYPNFYSDFMNYMLEAGDPRDTLTAVKNLQQIAGDKDFLALKKSVSETFPSLKEQEAALKEAFQYMHYYFPTSKTPTFITFFSGFSVQVPIGTNYVGIGLDMFLGADAPFYPALRKSIPHYISKRFTPENIVPRVTETYLRNVIFPEPDHFDSFIDNMIYQGKILYLMDLILPDIDDTLKIGYDAQQMKWANEYQTSIWAYFISENLLFESDALKTQKYIGEAPFTPGLAAGNAAAPKLGRFIGWQIVKAYMEEKPETSISTLLDMKDGQQFLQESRYKGK